MAERRLVSPKGREYRVLRTIEKDAYEEAPDEAGEAGATGDVGGKD